METKIPLITRSRLVSDLKELGVNTGQTVMLHVSVRAIGWIVGGPEVVLQSLLDVLGSEGTLMMYAGWEHAPDEKWQEDRQQACLEERPPFDPATSRALLLFPKPCPIDRSQVKIYLALAPFCMLNYVQLLPKTHGSLPCLRIDSSNPHRQVLPRMLIEVS